MTSPSNQDSEYEESKPKQKKRRKNESISPGIPDFGPLMSALWTNYADESKDDAFDQFMETLLENFLQSRKIQEDRLVEVDELVSLPSQLRLTFAEHIQGNKMRPLRSKETVSLLEELAKKDHLSVFESILSRKIKLERVIMFYLVSCRHHTEHVLGTEVCLCSQHRTQMRKHLIIDHPTSGSSASSCECRSVNWSLRHPNNAFFKFVSFTPRWDERILTPRTYCD
jgi:hypothetical protein